MSNSTTKHYIINYNDITNIPFVDIDEEKLQVINNKLTTIYADTNLIQGKNINISTDGYINVTNTFINDTDINKIYYNGNVGIGTTDPISLLNIYDNINNSNLLNINNEGLTLDTNINILKTTIQIGSDLNKINKIYCNFINDIDTTFLTENNLKNNIFYTRTDINGITSEITNTINLKSTEVFSNSSNYTNNEITKVTTELQTYSDTQNLSILNNSSNYSEKLFSNSSNYSEELSTNTSNYIRNEISRVGGDVISNTFNTNIRSELPELVITEEITSLRSETKSVANIIGNYNDTSGIILTANNTDNYKSFIILKSANSSSSVKIYNYDNDNLLISTNNNDMTAPTIILNNRKMIIGYDTSEYFASPSTDLYNSTNTLEIKGNININGNLKKNNETINLNIWSTQSNNVNYIGDIIFKDANTLTNTAYTNGSLVTIAGDLSQNKQGLIIEKSDRTQRIGITDSSIQQLGSAINANLSIKSKGSQPVTIGNDTTELLYVYSDKIGIGTDNPTEKLEVYGNIKYSGVCFNDYESITFNQSGWIKIGRYKNSANCKFVVDIVGSGNHDILEIDIFHKFKNATGESIQIKSGLSYSTNNLIKNIIITNYKSSDVYAERTIWVQYETVNTYNTTLSCYLILLHANNLYNTIGGLTFQTTQPSGTLIQTNDNAITYINHNLNILDGNVGIGISSPDYKLEVDGDINISAGSSFKINGQAIATTTTTTYTGGTGITISGTTINSDITQYQDSDVLTLLNTTGVTGGLKVTSGNVGIGTDNPTSILDIHGSQNWDGMTKLRLLNPASEYGRTHLQLVGRYENNNDDWSMSSGRNSIIFSTQTSKDATIVDTNTIQAKNGNLGIFTSEYSTSSPALVLNSIGNVGIGTDNPTEKLDVDGNVNIRQDLYLRNLPSTDVSSFNNKIYFDNIDDNGYANIAEGTSLGQIKFRLNENSDYIVGSIPTFLDFSMIQSEVDAEIDPIQGLIQGGLSFWTRSDGYTGTTGLQNRMCIKHNGNVGIGTNEPKTILNIAKTGDPKLRITGTEFNDTAGIQLLEGTNTATNYGCELIYDGDVNIFKINMFNGGSVVNGFNMNRGTANVGLGMTPTIYRLDVNGDINIASGSKYKINGNDLSYNDLAGTPPSSQWTTTGNDIYYNNGNVGIGTNNPHSKLYVNSKLVIGTDIDSYLTEQTTLIFGRGQRSNMLIDRHHYISTIFSTINSGNKIKFYIDDGSTINGTSHNNILTLTPNSLNVNGNVGIGTNEPKTILNIVQEGEPILRISGINPNNSAGIELMEGNNDGTYGSKLFYDGASNHFKINMIEAGNVVNALNINRNNGYVGIGTDNPNSKLHIYADNDVNNNLVKVLTLERHCDDITNTTNAEGGYISLVVSDDNANFAEAGMISWRADNADDQEDSGKLGFWVAKDDIVYERLTITKDGNVGIDKTSPSYKLDVNGDINIASGSKFKINGTNLNQTDIEGTLSVANGGTDATSIEQARTNLGIINNVKADWVETNTSVESYILNKPFTSLDSNTLEVTNGVLTVIGSGSGSGSGFTATTNIQEPTIVNYDDVTNGLIAHYKFDGDFSDSSGNGNNLSIGNGTPTFDSTEKVYGQSANFLSDDAYVETSLIDLSNTAFSISVWIKTTSISDDAWIITQGVTFDTNQFLHVGMDYNGGNYKYKIAFYGNGFSTTSTYESDINEWVHLVFVVSSNYNRNIYRNGKLIASDSNTSAFSSTGGSFKVGTRYTPEYGSQEDFTGYMDDLRVYDRALTATEVSTLYNNSFIASFTKTTIDCEYKYIKFENKELIWDFYPYNDATSWINYANIIGATYSLGTIQVHSGGFGVWTGGTTVGWIEFPPIPQGFDKAEIYFGNLYSNVVKLVINGTVVHTLSGVSSYTWYGSVNSGDVIRIDEDFSVIDANIKITLTNNQSSYSITFPENTECDILIVGGGGAGSAGHGGGGGAGELVIIKNSILNGTYTIKVGKGGVGGINYEVSGGRQAIKGFNSSFDTVIAEAGGTNTGTASDKNGGSGAGGDFWNSDGGTAGKGLKNTNADTYLSGTVYNFGNDGADQILSTGSGGGGGGAGLSAVGKDGGDGIYKVSLNSVEYNLKNHFSPNTNFGVYNTSDTYFYIAGGGGGGAGGHGLGGKGGGANGGGGVGTPNSGINNTGSGGGGGAAGGGQGGNGGSGIVIIRYKYASIPTFNVSGNLGVGTTTPDSKLHIYDGEDILKVSNSQITTFKSIIPSVDNTIDLGSVDNKFRDIFVSNLTGSGANITAINATNITSGTINNARLPSDISITGTLTTANLNVSGTSTTINTATYQTENLEIVSTNTDGPSLKITHNTNLHNALEIDKLGTHLFYISHDGKVGIGTNNPDYKLEVIGLTKTSAIILENKEANDFTNTEGLLIYDKNFYHNSDLDNDIGYQYGTNEWQGLNAFSQDDGLSGDGGGLSIYNGEDGWCHLYDTFNTRFANGVWNNLKIRDDVDKSLTISINKNTIQQTGTNTNADIFIKSKGTGSIIIGNETNNTLSVGGAENRVGIDKVIPTEKLEVNGNIKAEKFISKEASYASNQNKQFLVASNTDSTNSKEFSWNYKSNADSVFRTTVDYKSTSTSTPEEYFTIRGDGNVGIGINNPNYKLDVNGSFNCSSLTIGGNDINSIINIGTNIFEGTGTKVSIGTSAKYQDSILSLNVGNEETMLSSPDTSQFLWRINSLDKWGIYWSTNTSGNNYSMTTDSNPNEIIFVGNNESKASVDLDNGAFYSKEWFRTIGNGGWHSETHGGGWFMQDSTWIRSYGSKQVFIDSLLACDGRMGVGTSGPEYKLDVRDDETYIAAFRDTNLTQGIGIQFDGLIAMGSNTDEDIRIKSKNSGKVIFNTNNSDCAVFDGYGNLGIGMGITSPSEKLDVVGNIKLSGNILKGSTNYIQDYFNNNALSITGINDTLNTNNTAVGVHIAKYSTNHGYIDIRSSDDSGGWIDFNKNENSDYKTRIRGFNNPIKLVFYVDGTTERVTIESTKTTISNLLDCTSGIQSTQILLKRDSPLFEIDGINNTNAVINMITNSSSSSGYKLLVNHEDDSFSFIKNISGDVNSVFTISSLKNVTFLENVTVDKILTVSDNLSVAGTGNISNKLTVGTLSTDTSEKLHVNGKARITNELLCENDIVAYASDERLKKKLNSLSNVLENLENIDVFRYENTEIANKYFKNKLQIGLSAQEINKYYPEVVALAPFDSEYDESENKYISKSGENYLTLKYERLVAVSLQGIKELHKKNKDLETKIENLENKNLKLENELEKIKTYLNIQ